MDISEVNDNLENIKLPEETKKPILKLIDLKIDNDMKEVISEIREMKGEMRLTSDKLSSEIKLVNDKLGNEIKVVHDKLGNENKVIYWVVGIAMAVIILLIAKK